MVAVKSYILNIYIHIYVCKQFKKRSFSIRSNLPQDKVLTLQMGLLKVGLWLKPKVEHEFLFDSPGMNLLVDH